MPPRLLDPRVPNFPQDQQFPGGNWIARQTQLLQKFLHSQGWRPPVGGGLLDRNPDIDPGARAKAAQQGLLVPVGDVVDARDKFRGLLHTPDLLQQQQMQQPLIPHMGAGMPMGPRTQQAIEASPNVTRLPVQPPVTINPAPVVRPPGGFPPPEGMPSPGAMLAREGLIWQKSSVGRGRDPTHNPEILKRFEALPFTEQMKFSWMIKSAMEAGMDKPKDWTSAPPAFSRQEAVQAQKENTQPGLLDPQKFGKYADKVNPTKGAAKIDEQLKGAASGLRDMSIKGKAQDFTSKWGKHTFEQGMDPTKAAQAIKTWSDAGMSDKMIKFNLSLLKQRGIL